MSPRKSQNLIRQRQRSIKILPLLISPAIHHLGHLRRLKAGLHPSQLQRGLAPEYDRRYLHSLEIHPQMREHTHLSLHSLGIHHQKGQNIEYGKM